MEVITLGQMDNTIDRTFESANRVYSQLGVCPTISTCSGGRATTKSCRRWDGEDCNEKVQNTKIDTARVFPAYELYRRGL